MSLCFGFGFVFGLCVCVCGWTGLHYPSVLCCAVFVCWIGLGLQNYSSCQSFGVALFTRTFVGLGCGFGGLGVGALGLPVRDDC